MGSGTTIKSILLMTAIGASATNVPLPYQIDPLDLNQTPPTYRNIDELSTTQYLNLDEKFQIDTIINLSMNLIQNSKNIESEYVDIVNENFWDLI